jgi:hypothetical protein
VVVRPAFFRLFPRCRVAIAVANPMMYARRGEGKSEGYVSEEINVGVSDEERSTFYELVGRCILQFQYVEDYL